MRIIGIDLGKVNSQLSERDESGKELRNERFASSREGLTEVLAGGKARILVEAGTPARWVAELATSLGHEVIIADPNFLPMYVDRTSKRKKTDKRNSSPHPVYPRGGSDVSAGLSARIGRYGPVPSRCALRAARSQARGSRPLSFAVSSTV